MKRRLKSFSSCPCVKSEVTCHYDRFKSCSQEKKLRFCPHTSENWFCKTPSLVYVQRNTGASESNQEETKKKKAKRPSSVLQHESWKLPDISKIAIVAKAPRQTCVRAQHQIIGAQSFKPKGYEVAPSWGYSYFWNALCIPNLDSCFFSCEVPNLERQPLIGFDIQSVWAKMDGILLCCLSNTIKMLSKLNIMK